MYCYCKIYTCSYIFDVSNILIFFDDSVSLFLSIITKHLFYAQRTSSLSIFFPPSGLFLPSVVPHPDLLNNFHQLLRDGLVCSSTHCLQHLFTLNLHMCAHAGSTGVGCALNCYDPLLGGNFHSGINLSKIDIFTPFFLPPDQVFQHTPVIGAPRCSNQTKNSQ